MAKLFLLLFPCLDLKGLNTVQIMVLSLLLLLLYDICSPVGDLLTVTLQFSCCCSSYPRGWR